VSAIGTVHYFLNVLGLSECLTVRFARPWSRSTVSFAFCLFSLWTYLTTLACFVCSGFPLRAYYRRTLRTGSECSCWTWQIMLGIYVVILYTLVCCKAGGLAGKLAQWMFSSCSGCARIGYRVRRVVFTVVAVSQQNSWRRSCTCMSNVGSLPRCTASQGYGGLAVLDDDHCLSGRCVLSHDNPKNWSCHQMP